MLIPPGVALSSTGSCTLGWRRLWRLLRRCRQPKSRSVWFPWGGSLGRRGEEGGEGRGCRWDLYPFVGDMVSCWNTLSSTRVTVGEPIPGHCDVYSASTPKGHFGKIRAKGILFFFWKLVLWMLHVARSRDLGPVVGKGPLHELPVEFVNEGWLTNGDVALGSGAQFLAVAEPKFIPARARVSLHDALLSALSLSLVSMEFRDFFWLVRTMRLTIPTGDGGVVHLFVVYGVRGRKTTLKSVCLLITCPMLCWLRPRWCVCACCWGF